MAVKPLSDGTTLRSELDATVRYRVDGYLGGGGFGHVYIARDLAQNTSVVIKEFAPATMAYRTEDGSIEAPRERRPEFGRALARFVREAKALHGIKHPYVVRVHDAWRENGTAYYAMDRVDSGRPVPQCSPSPPLSPPKALELGRDLLEGLAAIHAAGLVHGDVKPDNVLLSADGSPRFIDFGTARTEVELQSDTVTLLFTPGWCAPELSTQGRLREAGAWSDLYAWGLIVWGLWLPHPGPGGTPIDAATRAVGPDPYANAATRLMAAGLPPGWAWSVEWALRLHPGARPASVDAVFEYKNGIDARGEAAVAAPSHQPVTTLEPAVTKGLRRGRPCAGCRTLAPPAARYCVRCGLELEGAVIETDIAGVASWPRRVSAMVVDLLIASVGTSALIADTTTDDEVGAVLVCVIVAYEALCLMVASTTLGKAIFGLTVRTAEGRRLGVWRALLRPLFRFPTELLTLGLGSFWAFLNTDRRTVCDYLAGTRVVRRAKPEAQ